MTWIANELSSHGIGLLVGQVVTTGTSIVPVPIEIGSRILADFGCFGIVTSELI